MLQDQSHSLAFQVTYKEVVCNKTGAGMTIYHTHEDLYLTTKSTTSNNLPKSTRVAHANL